MGAYGTNLTRAKKQANANAWTFGRPYYVVSTSAGLYVQREKPANPDSIVYVATETRAFAQHRQQDPHCTCPDCLRWHETQQATAAAGLQAHQESDE